MPHFLYVLKPLAFSKPEDLTEEQGKVLAEHFAYLQKLLAGEQLVLAGRTEAAEMGLVVFEAKDEASARAIMATDPAVKEGIMAATLYPYRLALLRKGAT